MTNAATDFANLPEGLATKHRALLDAMVQENDPNEWADEDKMVRAYAPEAIAKVLIPVYHGWLRGRPLAFLWRKEMERNGKITLGKASKASGKVRYFGEVDFVIEFHWVAWQSLSPRERVALVDHELTHCGVDNTDAGERLRMVPHDVEEFSAIVEKWGLWMPDLERFGKVVTEASQMSLFEPAGT